MTVASVRSNNRVGFAEAQSVWRSLASGPQAMCGRRRPCRLRYRHGLPGMKMSPPVLPPPPRSNCSVLVVYRIRDV